MSLLIKGMKMPKNCIECVFYRAPSQDYDYCCISSAIPKGYIPADCPLIEIPDHGRLVDVDVMERMFLKATGISISFNGVPTVIPAERSEDGET